MVSGLVSIIVPVYNCEKEINGCVNSILSSDYKEIEIIIINDGSTDGSEQVCKELSDRIPQIKYFYQDNSGVSVARNYGFGQSAGEYIMFVDGDDQIKSNLISALLEKMDPSTDIVCCSYEILGENRTELMFDNEVEASSVSDKEPFYLQLMDRQYGNNGNNATAIGVPWGKLFRREVISRNNIIFDPKLRRMQDNIFVMQSFYYANKIKYIPLGLYLYRVEHINSYNKGAYNHDVYEGVLRRRMDFFNSHKEIVSPQISLYLYRENLSYLMMSIHYIVAHTNSMDRAIQEIKSICSQEIHDILNQRPPKECSLKHKIQWVMLRTHMYRSLYYSYKIKYKL